MRMNTAPKVDKAYTHEGARATALGPEQELLRTVMACLLWEDSFYESGQSGAARIKDLIPKCRPDWVAACAYHARTKMKLRHIPLLICREMLRYDAHREKVGALLADCIQRPDEIAEFMAIYWLDGKPGTMPHAVRRAMQVAFHKFSAYQFAKWRKPDAKVQLRDVLFLAHVFPQDEARAALFKQIAENKLETPNTWETRLSAGEDKAMVFTDLMLNRELGALAFLRNLRNMHDAGVDADIIKGYAEQVDLSMVLPFRFIAAAKAAPQWEDMIEAMMLRALAGQPKLLGSTALLIDNSSSMGGQLSAKSDMTRFDAAIALAILLRELCEDVRIVGFSSEPFDIPPRRGFAMRDAVLARVEPAGTMLGKAVRHVLPVERVIVITDEQSRDRPPPPTKRGYILNVGTYENGIGYGDWLTISGWSEAVIDYIRAVEEQD